MKPRNYPTADGLIVSERPEFTDAELASLARQNPSLYEKVFGQQPIRYDNGIDPDLTLIRASVTQIRGEGKRGGLKPGQAAQEVAGLKALHGKDRPA